MAWLPSILRSANAPKKTKKMQPEDAPHDDGWTNVSIEGSAVMTDSLLLDMPSLFSKDLPPCGLHAQVAYENVVSRLRSLWLQRIAFKHSQPSILNICTLIYDDIQAEADIAPPGTRLGTKTRNPWRSEHVFRYEMRWAQYFVDEAKVLEQWENMTPREKEKQRFLCKLYPIPTCLQIYVKNIVMKKGILDMWAKWHEGKRGDLKGLVEEENDEAWEEETEEEEQENGDVKIEQEVDKVKSEEETKVKNKKKVTEIKGEENITKVKIKGEVTKIKSEEKPEVKSEEPVNDEQHVQKERKDKTIIKEEAPEHVDLGLQVGGKQ